MRRLRPLVSVLFAIVSDLTHFLRSTLRSRNRLVAENLFLRKQLAFYGEPKIRPRPLTDPARSTCVRTRALATVASDIMVWVAAGFRLMYVVVILDRGLRRLLQCKSAAYPSAERTLQQFREALPSDNVHRFLIPARDAIFWLW